MCESCPKHTTGDLGEALGYVRSENFARLNYYLISRLAGEGLADDYVRSVFTGIAERVAVGVGADIVEGERAARSETRPKD